MRAFDRTTFDITDAIWFDGQKTLAVRLSTRSRLARPAVRLRARSGGGYDQSKGLLEGKG